MLQLSFWSLQDNHRVVLPMVDAYLWNITSTKWYDPSGKTAFSVAWIFFVAGPSLALLVSLILGAFLDTKEMDNQYSQMWYTLLS